MTLMETDFGHVMMRAIDEEFVQTLKRKYTDPALRNRFNRIRNLMRLVTRRYIKFCKRPDRVKLCPGENAWQEVKGFTIRQDDSTRQNRRWPPEVIIQVMRAATPQFRMLLLIYILTAQRGGDVIRFTRGQSIDYNDMEVEFDPAAKALTFRQQKTGTSMRLPVADELAAVLTTAEGGSLLLTPKGKPWNTKNAQETLRNLLTNLGVGRYTLHGLRSTAVSMLAERGFADRVIASVTGHTDTKALKPYIAGYEQARTAQPAIEALAEAVNPLVRLAEIGANERRFAGVTGRAAAKLGVEGSAKARRTRLNRQRIFG
jgi:integrase